MTLIEIANKIVETKTYGLLKHRDGIDYDFKQPEHAGNKKGWVFFDLFTANTVKQIYNALSDDNKVKYISLPLAKFIDITWKLVR